MSGKPSIVVPTAVIAVAVLLQVVVFVLAPRVRLNSPTIVVGLWTVPILWVVILLSLAGLAREQMRGLSIRRRRRTYLAGALTLLVLLSVAGLIGGYLIQDQLRRIFFACHDLFGGDPPVCDPWLFIRPMIPTVGLMVGVLIGWIVGVRVLRAGTVGNRTRSKGVTSDRNT